MAITGDYAVGTDEKKGCYCVADYVSVSNGLCNGFILIFPSEYDYENYLIGAIQPWKSIPIASTCNNDVSEQEVKSILEKSALTSGVFDGFTMV